MRSLGVLAALALLAGCSLSTTLPDDVGGDASRRADADVAAGDAATDEAETGARDASPDSAGNPHEGVVSVSSAASDDSTVAIAFFGPGARDRERPVCVTARAGPCVRLECPGPYVASEDAGRIDVLGDGILVTSMSDPTHYTTVTLAPLGLGSGQRVTVTATGGAVPPFSASTTVPATTMSFSVPMSLDHGADLVVTWEPSTGPLIVSAGQLRNPVTVSCDVDAASGTVTIAASLLDAFSAGTLDVALAPWTRATVAAGDYTIDLYAFRTDLGYTVLR